jgi:hypothetical protein
MTFPFKYVSEIATSGRKPRCRLSANSSSFDFQFSLTVPVPAGWMSRSGFATRGSQGGVYDEKCP